MINCDRNNWTARKKSSHRSQIAIPSAKWRLSGHAILETTRFPRNSVLRSFWHRWLWIWHRIFRIQNGGHNMADIIFWKPNDFRGTLFSGAFGVADYEFDIGFPFFEMADLIWRTWHFGNSTIFAELCTQGFSGSLITNFKLDFLNSIQRIQYGRH